MNLVKKLGRRKYNYDICKQCSHYSTFKKNKTIRPTSHSCYFTTRIVCQCDLGRFRSCEINNKDKKYTCSDFNEIRNDTNDK